MMFLDEVQCSGDEEKIMECPHGAGLGTITCTHANDAGVICQAPGKVQRSKFIRLLRSKDQEGQEGI